MADANNGVTGAGGGQIGSRGGPFPSGAPPAHITPWPGSSLGPKIYTFTVRADGPGTYPQVTPPRTGGGELPVPGAGR
jgi:hypothetical protein